MMPAFARFIHAVSPAPAVAVVLCVLMISLGEEIHMIPPAYAAKSSVEPINLCDYSGPTFDEVNALLHDRVRPGDHVDKLRAAVSATPDIKFGKPKTGHFLNFTGNYSDGTFKPEDPIFIDRDYSIGAGVICQRENNNGDVWWIVIHSDKNQKIIEYQAILLYRDESFSTRGESLNASRYMDIGSGSRYLEKAVTDIWQAQSPTASTLFAMMDTAGFVDVTKNDYWLSFAFKGSGIPKLKDGAALQIYIQVVGVDGTSFSQDSLFFRMGWWVTDGRPYFFIIYNPETDAIISISADAPDSE